MTRFHLTLALLAAMAVPFTLPAQAAQAGDTAGDKAAAQEQASIPFFDNDNIRDWRADGTKGIYIEARTGEWYYGEFISRCTGLNFKDTIAFKNRPGSTFDRFGTIVFRDGPGRPHECRLKSLVKSEEPKGKKDKDDEKSGE